MTNVSATLSKGRKKRATSETLATAEDIGGYSLLSSNPLHATKGGAIYSVDLQPGKVRPQRRGAELRAGQGN